MIYELFYLKWNPSTPKGKLGIFMVTWMEVEMGNESLPPRGLGLRQCVELLLAQI